MTVPAALAAGACFAVAGVLQQWAAVRQPDGDTLTLRLVRRLAREPLWLAGITLAVLAYGFQALALAYGPLSLVQPLIISELLFAIPLSARLRRRSLGAREWLGTLAVTAGLTTALAAARPHGGDPAVPPGAWLATLATVGGLVALALAAGRRTAGAPRASLLGVAGGLVMGTQSVLLDATVDRLGAGPVAVLTAWQTYLLVVASVAGLVLIQSAFQAGPLAASMPAIDATEPAVAVTVGVAVFGETVSTEPLALSLTAVGVAVLLAGIVLLDTSQLFRKLE
ncbi:DMT family transporter [Streptomyces sp. MUM 203J]|uniref:DMT family transporter n=1 Tax=Streptomyces sp. MUM 203J TaxID=2791990 RepID=UPI001F03CA59|nr:DMT family transporter [Streptomyces sp. MUM 203J]MCH0541464.1 DMT family transporter [Streptomyces sp. MUM 203J]